jgi:predicted O-methyltransferase YrrM
MSSLPVLETFIDNEDAAYTSINGVIGPFNEYDIKEFISCIYNLPSNAKYIETGSYLGFSSLLVALHSDNTTIWAHDLWLSEWSDINNNSMPPPEIKDYFFTFYNNIKKHNLTNRIIPIRGDSKYTIAIHDDNSIDLALIDGDHSYNGCFGDLKAILPKMKKNNSVILIHDCIENTQTFKALEDFSKENSIQFEILPNTCGLAKIIF